MRLQSRTRQAGARRSARGRVTAALGVIALAAVTFIATPSAASAAPNGGIIVGGVTFTPADTQATIGDTFAVSGTWDATQASPQPGDEFTIGLPPELAFPEPVPFTLNGEDPDGTPVVWGNCLTDPKTNVATCTLTSEVAKHPENVKGTWRFDVEAKVATTEEAVEFDLNGEITLVDLPGEGGIDDGIDLPSEVSKSGVMNSNNWSMTWTIDVPGARMAGQDSMTLHDTLGAGHALCSPTKLTVQTVRGSTVVDVTDLVTSAPAAGATDFAVVLTAPEGGFDPNVTYRISYQTCTPDGMIDPAGTEYSNSAQIEGWGDTGIGIGTVTNRPWLDTLTKSGSVLGGTERNGKVSWTISIPGDQLASDGSKTSFTITDTLGAGHELCADTMSSMRVYERYGSTNQVEQDLSSKLTAQVLSESAQGFSVKYTISDPDFAFKPSDYRYLVAYTTCVTEDGLPAGGTEYTNTVQVDSEITTGKATVPGRSQGKTAKINTAIVEIDGVEHMPQTTLNWAITIPGERIESIDTLLTLTDTLSASHMVCAAGDPSGGLKERLQLKVEARDQISKGGLATVDLTDAMSVSEDANVLTLALAATDLPIPGGTSDGFSREYQYIVTYTTCTTSGGMDAPGTIYGNTIDGAGIAFHSTVTQQHSGSGTGQGVTRGSVSINKQLADTIGASLVPAGTAFTVHVKEIDPTGVTQMEYDVQVPLDGSPVSGFNARGSGWTFEVTEPTFPSIAGVVFGSPKFAASPGVTVSEDGTKATAAIVHGSNIAISLENEALLGSVAIAKELIGGAAGLVEADKTYQVTAAIDTSALGADFPAQPDRTLELTAGGPTQYLNNLPIGATVTFTEVRPTDDDTLTWGAPEFAPSASVVVGDPADETAFVQLTNSVERTVGTFDLTKTVTGEQASNPAVPAAVEVTATWADAEGIAQSKAISVPTDGTPAALGENLLIGTEVTLTETPLTDGSGIAWGDPVWSGTNVTVDGLSAVVTIGRDADASVSLENKAATSVAGISLMKGLAGEAAGEVAATTPFPVTATWTIDGVDDSVELTINAVEPTPLGVDLPAGTVVTITEGTQPGFDRVDWGSITISGEGVVDAGDGSAQITVSDQQGAVTSVTVTNEANWAWRTFDLTKTVTGEQASNPAVPAAVEVTATWTDAEGIAQSKVLDIPTDGTAVAFGEDLLVGTVVTLTETPLVDGSSIAWGAPVWSGTNVSADGSSAVVTIGRDTDASVSLENHAATSVAGISILKGIAGAAAGEVAATTPFPVTATWTIDGVDDSVELTINAVEPTPLGVDLPAGTVVTITEGTQPGFDRVDWGSITISGEGVVDAGDGSAQITVSDQQGDATLVTVVNEAAWAPGTFAIAKSVEGIRSDDPSVAESVTVIATWQEGEAEQSAEISVPTAGTSVTFPRELPHGTVVTLTEVAPENSARFSWASPTWSGDRVVDVKNGSATVVIGAADEAQVSLVNTAVPSLGEVTITKTITGSGAQAAADTVFPVTLTWLDLLGEVQSRDVELVAGESIVVEDLPLGTEIRMEERDAELAENLTWTGATWTSTEDNVTVNTQPQSAVATITVDADPGARVELALENAIDAEENLVVTGMNPVAVWVLVGAALVFLVSGATLIRVRRRS